MDSSRLSKDTGADGKKDGSGGWQKGLNLALQLSGWLIGPLILALFLGRYLDDRYQTKPWLFLLSTGIAFGITVLGMTLETVKYIKNLEKELKDPKDEANPKS